MALDGNWHGMVYGVAWHLILVWQIKCFMMACWQGKDGGDAMTSKKWHGNGNGEIKMIVRRVRWRKKPVSKAV